MKTLTHVNIHPAAAVEDIEGSLTGSGVRDGVWWMFNISYVILRYLVTPHTHKLTFLLLRCYTQLPFTISKLQTDTTSRLPWQAQNQAQATPW